MQNYIKHWVKQMGSCYLKIKSNIQILIAVLTISTATGCTIVTSEFNGYYNSEKNMYRWLEFNSGGKIVNEFRVENPSSFVSLNKGYAKTDTKVYLRGVEIRHAHPATFEVLGGLDWFSEYSSVSRDKNYVFYAWDIVHGADPYSVRLIAPNFLADNRSVFAQTCRVPNIEPEDLTEEIVEQLEKNLWSLVRCRSGW